MYLHTDLNDKSTPHSQISSRKADIKHFELSKEKTKMPFYDQTLSDKQLLHESTNNRHLMTYAEDLTHISHKVFNDKLVYIYISYVFSVRFELF